MTLRDLNRFLSEMDIKVSDNFNDHFNLENIIDIFKYIENKILKKYENEVLSKNILSSMKYEIASLLDSLIARRILYNKYFIDINEFGGKIIIYEPRGSSHTRFINFNDQQE
ncbi:MAG: hypothetical protein ACOCP4_00735 [Candidatus Woesearchaeota archaeon]